MTAALQKELEVGLGFQKQGNFQEAESIYGRAIAENPDSAAPWHAFGMAKYQQGEYGAAADAFSRAILIDSGQSHFFNNYGAALQGLGRCADAIAAYRAALQLQPEYLDASLNLLRALNQQLQWSLAFGFARKSIQLWPENFLLLQQAVLAAENAGRIDMAVEWLQQSIGVLAKQEIPITPTEHAELLRKLGVWYLGLSRPLEAKKCLLEANHFDPQSDDGHFQLARAFDLADDVASARKSLSSARNLAPQNIAWKLAEIVCCPRVFRDNEELAGYRSQLGQQLDELLATNKVLPREAIFKAGFVPPYGLGFQGLANRELKEKFARICSRSFRPIQRQRNLGAKKRVAFLVTPGHEQLFLRCQGGILQRLNRSRFEVIVACHAAFVQRMATELKCNEVEFIPLSHQFRVSARQLAEARLDLLYYWELGSDALNYFLPFTCPAPVQCLSWGSQDTSGIQTVDHYLSSKLVDAHDAAKDYTETLWPLNTLPTWQERLAYQPVGDKSRFAFPSGSHLYVCPQNVMKCQPADDQLWGNLLRNDPRGILVFKEGPFPQPTEIMRERLQRSINDVSDRIRFIPWQSRQAYFDLLAAADVLLDPPGFSAGGSAFDAFSFNLPIVTLSGNTFVSRFTSGCYRKMGLPELIAASPEEYVKLAHRLASEPDFKNEVRAKISARTPLLFEDNQVTSEFQCYFDSVLAASDSR